MKKLSIFLSILCAAVFLMGCDPFDDRVYFEEVAKYVNENYKLLEAFPLTEMPSYDDTGFIKEHLGRKTIVKQVSRAWVNEGIIDFYCGGKGNASNSIYTGFYYSKNNEPFSLCFGQECTFTEVETGVFEWKNSDESHQSHIRRIRENWFYYYEIYY